MKGLSRIGFEQSSIIDSDSKNQNEDNVLK